jgi:class I fructose-bisphosphate aldolase
MIDNIVSLLGDKADYLLKHNCQTIPTNLLHLPGPDWVDRIFAPTNRNQRVLNNLQRIYNTGRLAGTDTPFFRSIRHRTLGGASFPRIRSISIPENIVKLAVEGGCNAVASTFGVLGAVARKYARKIPFLAKINHNELLTYPNQHKEILFGTVNDAYEMGAAAIGATIYFGSDDASREIVEISEAFAFAHELGMATVLWCYLRNSAFKKDKDYHLSADLTGQANHLGCTIQADIIKQKLPENNGGYKALNTGGSSYGKLDERIYTKLTSDHPIDLCRYQVANCFTGRAGLINSGGASGEHDFADAAFTAVVNKRAGGTGLISGRKAFQRPMEEGAKLLNTIQDVYLCKDVTVA